MTSGRSPDNHDVRKLEEVRLNQQDDAYYVNVCKASKQQNRASQGMKRDMLLGV
jgi:hypothetical protein